MLTMTRALEALCAITIALAIPAPAAITRTTVVFFSPWVSSGLRHGFIVSHVIKGSCWTNSLSTDRPDAWRCMAGDDILDPCFAGPPRSVSVACAESPFSKSVVLQSLKKPLSDGKYATTTWLQPKGEPWALRLTNGDTCYFATGATDVVAGMRLNHECNKGTWILGFPDRSTAIWTAHWTAFPKNSHVTRVRIAIAVF